MTLQSAQNEHGTPDQSVRLGHSVTGRAIRVGRPSASADVTSHRLRRHRPPRDDPLLPDARSPNCASAMRAPREK
jgi:hypothetical protein